MVTVEDLKEKDQITRSDIAELLSSIGKPGENREEKYQAVASLGRSNFQGFGAEATLEEYQEY